MSIIGFDGQDTVSTFYILREYLTVPHSHMNDPSVRYLRPAEGSLRGGSGVLPVGKKAGKKAGLSVPYKVSGRRNVERKERERKSLSVSPLCHLVKGGRQERSDRETEGPFTFQKSTVSRRRQHRSGEFSCSRTHGSEDGSGEERRRELSGSVDLLFARQEGEEEVSCVGVEQCKLRI